MIALAALLLAVPCDVEPVLRAVTKASLPAQTARNVTAKVRYAAALCKTPSISPPDAAAEALRTAREWAHADRGVTRAIDGALHDFAEQQDVPARLTIRVNNGLRYTIDGVVLEAWDNEPIVLLRAGRHEIAVISGTLGTASAAVTLAPGEMRTLELTPKQTTLEELRNGFFLYAHGIVYENGRGVVTPESLPRICIDVDRGRDGVSEPIASLERVTLDKSGLFDITALFAVKENGRACVADAAALREIVDRGGPMTIRLSGALAGGRRFDEEQSVTFRCTACRDAANHDPERRELMEEVQTLTFHFSGGAGGTIEPHVRWTHRSRMLVAEREELLQGVGEVPGVLAVRAYAEDGTLVFRAVTRLQLVSAGCFPASNSVQVDVPETARVIEIKGWSPQTTGRFEAAQFRGD